LLRQSTPIHYKGIPFGFSPCKMCRCRTNHRFPVFLPPPASCLKPKPRTSAQDQGGIISSQLVSSMKKENRTKKIDARFTEAEYNIILALEKELGISKTDLVRSRLLDNAPAVVLNAKELIRTLDSISAELGHSGNNINQLARYANILNKKRILSPMVMENFNKLFKQYLAQQQILETTLRRVVRAMTH
jgi:hypothetical protein